MLKYSLDRDKTQEMSDKAADSFLPTLKFVSDWFVTSKMTENFDKPVFSIDDMVLGDIDSDFITFFSNDKDLNNKTLNNINLDYDNFHNYHRETINHARLMTYEVVYNLEDRKLVQKTFWDRKLCMKTLKNS